MNLSEKIKNPSTLVPIIVLVVATLICLLPFDGKAFNIDEPLFVWTAKQIQLHPLDFYDFDINWYGTWASAASIIKNPPLASYYLALAAALFGWNELPLHLAFTIPAIAAVVGTFFLARELTRNPLPAALIALLNPVFILCGTTVMCDTMMVAFYVWAVYFWVRGTRNDRPQDFFISAILIALCSLTKYFGVSLIPLLLVYSLLSAREKRKGALFLILPVLILALYQWETWLQYGRGLLSDAAGYASTQRDINAGDLIENIILGLAFTGGCLITVPFFAGRLWTKRAAISALVLVALTTVAVKVFNFPQVIDQVTWPYHPQLALFISAGAALLYLAVAGIRLHKDPESTLLCLWIVGTFAFAAVVNWSANGRSVLPMAPAAAIALVRLLEGRVEGWNFSVRALAVPTVCAFLLSMTVTWADFTLAQTSREAAKALSGQYTRGGKHPWFQGHWGFQYYMEKYGGIAYDKRKVSIESGDMMLVPENNTNIFDDIYSKGTLLKIEKFQPAGFVSTMSQRRGAGYYSSRLGAIPFAFGSGFEENYHILLFQRAVVP